MNTRLEQLGQEISKQKDYLDAGYFFLVEILGVDGKEIIPFYEELDGKIRDIRKDVEIQSGKKFENFTDEELILVGEKILAEFEMLNEKFERLIKERAAK